MPSAVMFKAPPPLGKVTGPTRCVLRATVSLAPVGPGMLRRMRGESGYGEGGRMSGRWTAMVSSGHVSTTSQFTFYRRSSGTIRQASHMDYELEKLNREQAVSEVDPFTERRYRQFARHLEGKISGRVLDVGCNTGRGGAAFTAAMPNVVLDGVELVPDRIARIPGSVYRNVYQGLLQDIPVDAEPYDAMLMGELIEHVPFAVLDELIEQSVRLLAPGGRLLLTTPNPHYVLLRRRSGGSVLGGAHISVHCPVALRQYLAWKGMAVETVTGSGQVSSMLGGNMPMALYGSYLLMARKPLT